MSQQPWKDNEQRNWEYGDLRLRALDYILRTGGDVQAISLRGHLLLDVAVTQLLRSHGSANISDLTRAHFWQKNKEAQRSGLISREIRSLLSAIARIRNSHAHDPAAHSIFRQIFALTERARVAGIQHRFFTSEEEETKMAHQVAQMGDRADRLFSPSTELADLCAELFSHLVFWNYERFDLTTLKRTLVKVY